MPFILIIIAIAIYIVIDKRKMHERNFKLREEYGQQLDDLKLKYNNELSAMELAHMNRVHEDEVNYLSRINELQKDVDGLVKEGRKDAVKRSKQVVSGQVYEQISPLVPGFPYELRDARHVGSPLDFIIFRGLSSSHADIEIVFLEIKTGMSTLNSNERRVKKAVDAGRVKYDVFHPDLDQNIEQALEASIVPIRPTVANVGELIVTGGAIESIRQEFINEPTETLTCGHCKKAWDRPIAPGRKPLFCPTCRGTG